MIPDLPGLCVDHPEPELWFAKGDARYSAALTEAIRICGHCPCRQACLDETNEREESPGWNNYGHRYGVAGGLTANQRTRARKAAA